MNKKRENENGGCWLFIANFVVFKSKVSNCWLDLMQFYKFKS